MRPALSYAGVYGDVRKELLVELAVETRSLNDRPKEEEKYFGSDLNNGWYLILAYGFAHGYGTALTKDSFLVRLSANTEVVLCIIDYDRREECVIYSAAIGWENGEKTWEVIHDRYEGRDHLATTGRPPTEFEKIRKVLMEKQKNLNDGDYVGEIPAALVDQKIGFGYNRGRLVTTA